MSTPARRPADQCSAPVEPAGDVRWCDRCGSALAAGGHDVCVGARALEPPRYCGRCGRRMKVQVLPAGWAARCVEHGEVASSAG